MDIELFDFALPEELIAQTPMEQRDECRLLVVNREKRRLSTNIFMTSSII
jgi:S-adenosylmethionine:tRNA ribosyltransferase-isomerase